MFDMGVCRGQQQVNHRKAMAIRLHVWLVDGRVRSRFQAHLFLAKGNTHIYKARNEVVHATCSERLYIIRNGVSSVSYWPVIYSVMYIMYI